MVSYFIVRAGLPVPAGSLVIVVIGFLLGIFAQDFFGAIFGFIGNALNGIYYALPSSWMESSRKVADNGDITIYGTQFSWYFSDLIDFFRRPGSGVLMGMSMALYWIFELICLVFFYQRSTVRVINH